MSVTPALTAAVAGGSELPLALLIHGSAEMYGADKVLLNLAAGIANSAEFKPVVVLHEEGPLRTALVALGVEVHVANVVKLTRAVYKPAALLALLRQFHAICRDLDCIAAGRQVGVVHSNTLAVLGGSVWAWRRRLPHLWHVHEIILKPLVARRALPRLAERLSQRVVSISAATEAWLLGEAPRLSSRSVVIFNGLPALPPEVPAASRAFRSQIGAGDDDVVVTVAGRLNHWKGQGLLIDAIALLSQEGRLGAVRLAIVGDVFAGHEDFKSKLVAQVRSLGLDGRVSFVPFVDDIYAVWRGSQIAVVPSIEPEPFGMVAIEAMACKLPVLAAAHGGLLDIVVDQVTGLLFEPTRVRALADALARLAGDASLRERLGANGAQRQRERFALSAQVAQFLSVYCELAAQRGPLARR